MANRPSLAQLRRALRYNRRTGIFTWKRRDDVPPEWNTRWAGKRAGRYGKGGGGYVSIVVNYYPIRANRLAWAFVHGTWPRRLDHKNGDRRDNRIANLRPATSTQNNRNRGPSRSNRSGFKGVSWCELTRRWRATISGRHLGRFDTPEAAHAAYVKAARSLHGRFARPG